MTSTPLRSTRASEVARHLSGAAVAEVAASHPADRLDVLGYFLEEAATFDPSAEVRHTYRRAVERLEISPAYAADLLRAVLRRHASETVSVLVEAAEEEQEHRLATVIPLRRPA